MEEVNAILVGDVHLRDDQPVCRTDDYWQTQMNVLANIFELQEKYQCPVLQAGDLFHKARPSYKLLAFAMDMFDGLSWRWVCIPGQHDLPNHSWENIWDSAFGILIESERITHVESPYHINVQKDIEVRGFGWGKEIVDTSGDGAAGCLVAITHQMVYKRRPPYPGCEGNSSVNMLRKYDWLDLILCGDNHQAFTYKHDGRLVVNPGSMMRMTAAQADFKPRVYLWNAEANEVEAVYVDTEEGVVNRDHIDAKQEKDERIQAYIERMGGEWEADLDFRENLQRYFATNRVQQAVRELILESLEGTTE